MPSSFFETHLEAAPIIAILRGLSTPSTVELAQRCWEAGIRLVEVPAQSPAALDAITAAAEYADGITRFIGAGTICTAADTVAAHASGAQFLVSPGTFPDSIRAAAELKLPYLPGVGTATEMHTALSLGLHVQKLFPADSIRPQTIKTFAGPYPTVRLVAVGGVTPASAPDYLNAGALGVGVGNALSDERALREFSTLIPNR
ncbi:bifunctional 4-hydroxy-2-oxoglutarate aldolase/2-dehydro-3-deoxy-phosphogluconate aldolase [Lysinibacter cavernae]|uniref:Entner-Doudoroff aldolase n=1 Tax=Lysinibacter cavernae TaxID=1640652 RepID=A0A7X5R375_9MICO|nr:Entner-Doudoroff aldolase [Lysinibacter cavernae]